MAFRGDATAVRVSDVQISPNDVTSDVLDQNTVGRSDALRVRFALGLIIVVAVLDCLLYLPRLF